MSGLHHVSTRSSPPQVRKSATKSSRSAPSTKINTQSRLAIKTAKVGKHRDEEEEIFDFEDDDNMATSFLQYCAMCEKQILTPNNSILYCSESCRRRDACPIPTSAFASLNLSSPRSPLSKTLPSYSPAPFPHPDLTTDTRKPPLLHQGTSDLDPTEWKPSDPSLKPKEKEKKAPASAGNPTDAFTYLSTFHRSTDSVALKRRGLVASAGRSVRATPSLSHTPTTSSASSSEGSLVGSTPFEFVARPTVGGVSMPGSGVGSAAELEEDGVVEVAGGVFERRVVDGGKGWGSASGSLKKLLGSM